MHCNSVAIVIPVYKYNLKDFEILSMVQGFKIFDAYEKIFIAPASLDISKFEQYGNFSVEFFPDECFKSIKNYNKLMLEAEFYRRFNDFEYILIYQHDAFVFSDQLPFFCSLGYDYYGAPWLEGIDISRRHFRGISYFMKIAPLFNPSYYCYIGNGGLSLRKISTTIDALKKYWFTAKTWNNNEDYFYSLLGVIDKAYRVAPFEVALGFSWEMNPQKCLELNNGRYPFGCHAFDKHETEFYQKVFALHGYNLRI